MFIPNNDVKIVCKLEKDDGNTIKIRNKNNGTHDYNKVKLTTLASNISIKDVFHFSPSFLHHTGTKPGLVYFLYEGGTYKHTFNSSWTDSVNFNYIPYYGSSDKKSLYDSNTYTYFDYEKFVLSSGKVDLYRYQLGDSNPWLSLRASGQCIENMSSSIQAIEIVDVYDNPNHVRDKIPGQKIGTLPISYPYFDITENKVKIISFDNEAKMVLLDTPSQYFTLESKDGNQYGYFSDENGNPSEYDNSIIQRDFLDKFPVNCTALDFVQLANIEGDAQKTLELGENHHYCASSKKGLKDAEYSAKAARKWAEEAQDEAKHSAELAQKSIESAQKSAEIAVTAHDVKIVCKLEKDDGNTITIHGMISSGDLSLDKVKATTIGSNTSIDIGILDLLSMYYISTPSSGHPSLQLIHPKGHNVTWYTLLSGGTFLTYKDNTFYLGRTNHGDIGIDPKRILTIDGKPIDATQYTGNKKLELVQGEKIEGTNYVVDLYDYDSNTSTRGSRVGTLPTKFIAIDQSDSKIKLFKGQSNGGIKPLIGGYLTLKYKEDGVVGYFSDENGTKDAGLDDEFQIKNMGILDLIYMAQIEELAQKNLELEESNHSHSAALNSAQVKSKAISTVINRVRRQVEEDAAFKDDIKDLLKSDKDFKKEVKGEPGPPGIQGPEGDRGANAQEVADQLVYYKSYQLGNAVLSIKDYQGRYSSGKSKLSVELAKDSTLQIRVKDLLKSDKDFKKEVKGDKGDMGPIGPRGQDGQNGRDGTSPTLNAVAAKLKANQAFKDDVKGDTGSQGIQGLKGEIGQKGEKGERGLKGETGQKGEQGLKGETGPAGSTGKDGAIGPQGARGNDGPAGPKGVDGQNGRDGTSPTPNAVAAKLKANQAFKDDVKGDTGSQGIQGLKGEIGQKGEKGERGLKGKIGQKGEKGEQGLKGETGPAGSTGKDGAIGPQGARGNDGPAGPKGDIGPKGVDGQNGRDGTSPTLNAVAAKLKANQAFKDNVKGDTGSQGIQGLKGEIGQKGEKGERGLKGKIGQKGEKGEQGLKGETGPAGSTGKDGAIGPQGARGNDGPAGPKGDIGPKGVDGQNGRDGTSPTLNAVAAKLKANQAFKDDVKGDTGAVGPTGSRGDRGANAQEVANYLVDYKSIQLGEAVLNVGKYNQRQGYPGPSTLSIELAQNPFLKRGVKDLLKSDPGQTKGPQGNPGAAGRDGIDGKDGNDAKPEEVADKLLDKVNGNNIVSEVAKRINKRSVEDKAVRKVTDKVDVQDVVSKIDVKKLTEGVVNKLTPGQAEKIAMDTTDKVLNPQIFNKGTEFSHKFAELLFDRSSIDKGNADVLVRDKVSGWGLAKYLLIHSNLNKPDTALPMVEQKIDGGKLAESLLEYAGLKRDVGKSETVVEHIVNHFFNTGSTGIASRLKHDARFKRAVKGELGPEGEKGDIGPIGPSGPQGIQGLEGNQGEKGERGPKGADGKDGAGGRDGKDGTSPTPDAVAIELVTNKKDMLGEAVLNVPDILHQGSGGFHVGDSKLLAELARNSALQIGVKNLLEDNQDFKDSVKGDTGSPGIQGPPGKDGPQGKDGRDAVMNLNPLKIKIKQTEAAVEKVKEDQRTLEQVNQQKIQSIESDIQKLQVPHPQSASLTQSSVSQQDIEEAAKRAETARDSAEKSAEKSENSAVNSHNIFQDILQSRSNFDKEKSGVIVRANRVRRSTEELRDSATEEVKKAENSKNEAQKSAESAQQSAEIAKDLSVNSLHEIAQRYSNLNRDKSDISQKAHRIKRSMEAKDNLEKNEETSQILTMHDVRKLLEKETSGISSRIKRNTENILDLSEGKMVQKINKEVMQMKSSIENVSMQVEETQEKIQEVEQIATKAENSANKMRNEMEGHKSSATVSYVNAIQEKKDQLKIVQSNDNSTDIEIEGKGVIAKFSKVGYYFHNGQLHIHNPETQIDVALPSEFNFLKVIEHPEKPTHYMLVLVNQLGNELFEHKKYDLTFSSLANEFKFIDSQQIKISNKINFNNGLYFILKPGDIELSNSQNYAVDVYEIGSNKKIGTLIDEFCYYRNGQFNYTNYHTGDEIHHSSSHEHNLSIEQREDYQAKISIVCGENNEKVAFNINPIITSEFGLLEYLADHSLV